VRRILLVLTIAALAAAMMVASAVPAMAQVVLDFNDDDRDFDNNAFRGFDFGGFDLDNENELESGPVDQEFSVRNTGDYANQCVPAQQFGNSGNFNNAPSFVQFDSDADDFEPGGIEVGFGGEVEVDCSSTVEQSSAASS
jgi:hypothetical protein